jgi:hypothetical protein
MGSVIMIYMFVTEREIHRPVYANASGNTLEDFPKLRQKLIPIIMTLLAFDVVGWGWGLFLASFFKLLNPIYILTIG